MGSAQSQPARPSRRRQQSGPRSHDRPSSSNHPSMPTASSSTTRPAPSESRFASLRRLSALGRRDSQKRDRATSPSAEAELNGAQQKKRRVGSSASSPSALAVLQDPQTSLQSSPAPITVASDTSRTPRAGPSAPLQHGSLPTSPGPPVLPTLPVPYHQPGSSSAPLPSPPIDPLLPDRLETLDTIRNTLGSDWSANTLDPVTTEERLQRITTTLDRIERTRAGHRDSLPEFDLDTSHHHATASASTPPSAAHESSSTRITDRVCSFLGIGNGNSAATDTTLPASTDNIETDSLADASADYLQERIERARADLAEVQRQLEAARAVNAGLSGLSRPETRGASAAVTGDSAGSEVESGPGQQGGPQRRIPAGAVLVIQGLAQTHAPERPAARSQSRRTRSWMRSETSPERPARGRARSSSDSHVSGPGGSASAGDQTDSDGVNESLDGQARMISNLLTVAAAATAQTLLVPEVPPPEPRSPSSALSNVIDRLRPQRRRPPPVETALGNYLRDVLRDRSRVGDTPAITGGGMSDASGGDSVNDHVPSPEFQQFLDGLQVDLVGAVRQFATPPNELDEGAANDPAPLPSTPSVRPSENGASSDRSANALRMETSEDDMAETASPDDQSGSGPEGNASASEMTPVPAFHYQLGQNRPDDAMRRFGVSGGTNGQPRRLNFFRAHLFPPVRADQPGVATGADDPNGMVPCIFIGVRSLNHDPSLTTDELVQHPNFPFLDGQAPAAAVEGRTETTGSATGSTASLPSLSPANNDRPATPSPAAVGTSSPPARRTLRDRALGFLTPGRQRPAPAPRPLNTYLVFVIGGHYPRSHPILSIPSLLTGDPLTDEEMVRIGELMGPGKPPTASKEDIENAGLKLVDASEIARLGEAGVVLENCVDRCLVCLGDYESGEECRVLKCRHAYHRECVDEWLSKGRNSCPACRTEVVETKQNNAAAGVSTSAAPSNEHVGAA